MEEREIINKIKSLQKIEPNGNWVSLTKSEIFDNTQRESFSSFIFRSFFTKSAMTAFASLGFIALIFVSAQGSFPGDSLYPVKRAAEKGRIIFVSQENRQDFNIEMANKRLEEISEIVRRNQIEKLSLAIKELEAAKSEMQKDFARSVESKPKEEKVDIAKNFASTILKIEDREGLIFESLGVRVDENKGSLNNKDLAFFLIQDLEERSLTEEDELLLKKSKEFFEQGNYSLALRFISQAGQPTEEDSEDEKNEKNEEN